MNNEITKILAITLNIYPKNDNDATIKILSDSNIYYLLVKGFYKNESKNKANIFIGSISEFEIFNQYGNNNNFLLKKANLINFYDYDDLSNKDINEVLFYLFQQLEEKNSDFFKNYLNYFFNENTNKKYLLSYLANFVLKTKGKSLILDRCCVCGSNQDLYCIDIHQGGMFCFKHKIEWAINKNSVVKSFYYLSQSFDDFCQNINNLDNNIILKSLINFVSD